MKKLVFMFIALIAIPAFATVTQIATIKQASISVYSEPDTHAKPAMTLGSGQKMIAIYEKNDWIKIANPDNGDIGWIKKSEWQSATKNVITIEQVGDGYSVTSKNSNGAMNSSYHVMQTNGNNKVTSEEMNTFLNDWQKQQQTIQQHFDQIRQDMMKNMELFDTRMKQLWKENTQQDQPQKQKDNSKK